jgi:nucleoside-diphosphate-sugar epimerase
MTKGNSSEKMAGRLYWIGGSKGGVGKSMMTFAIVDYLVERGNKVVLVDCDTSNPDAWKAYRELVPTELANLDEVDGWIHLVNTCEAHRGSVVVVNTAARNNVAVKRFGQTLFHEEVGRCQDNVLGSLQMAPVGPYWGLSRLFRLFRRPESPRRHASIRTL